MSDEVSKQTQTAVRRDVPLTEESLKEPASKLLLSYRFLRCGIIAVGALLIGSLIYEIVSNEGCVRDSISAYFYSPVRTTFTGGLIAIGVCFIVLQGDDGLEEFSLNIAGMLAPVVAFVPTNVNTACQDSDSSVSATKAGEARAVERLAMEVAEGMRNNMAVYLGVVLVALLLLVFWPGNFVTNRQRLKMLRIAIGGYAVVLIGFTLWLRSGWDGKDSGAHNVAAYTMFGFFGIVVFLNGFCRRETTGLYKSAYIAILASMAGAAVAILCLVSDRYRVFVLEAVEIGLFLTFWIIQTVQFRNDDPKAGVVAGIAAPTFSGYQ